MARRPQGADKAKRLVALVGHLHPGQRMKVSELAQALAVSEAQLVDDLDTLSMCGVAPYDPGDLAPIYVEDGYVEVWGDMPALSGPVRLSAAEASALAAALQAAGFEPDNELVQRLMTASAGEQFSADSLARTIRAAQASHDPEVFETLAEGVRSRRVVSLTYTKSDADASSREIEPVSLFAERDAWYVTGWCRVARDWRTFRLDRIREASLSTEVFGDHVDVPHRSPREFSSASLPVATLRFLHGGFDPRRWPGATVVETRDDVTIVEVPYAGTAWIARAVCAGLGDIVAEGPEEVRSAVVSLATDELARLQVSGCT